MDILVVEQRSKSLRRLKEENPGAAVRADGPDEETRGGRLADGRRCRVDAGISSSPVSFSLGLILRGSFWGRRLRNLEADAIRDRTATRRPCQLNVPAAGRPIDPVSSSGPVVLIGLNN